MDFGVDRLIEMFEERFGKGLATALLALIGLAAAGWAIHSVAIYIARPSWNIGVSVYGWMQTFHTPHIVFSYHRPQPAPNQTTHESWGEAGLIIYGYVSAFVALYILDKIWVRFFNRRHIFTRFFARDSFDHIRQMHSENEALKERIAELESELGPD
jgi:hypothetical protein